MSEIEITVKFDRTEEVIAALADRLPVALEAIGMQAENYAKLKCPVDTGLLRNSITHAVAGNGAAIKSYHASKGSVITSREVVNGKVKNKRRSATAKNAGEVGVGFYAGTIGDEGEASVYIGTNVDYAAYV